MILLDTNVVSEATRVDAAPGVLEWINRQAAQTLYISSFTVAEMAFGIGTLPKGKRREEMASFLEAALRLFESRILPFDDRSARRYAELAVKARKAGRGFPIPDGYIAAIASAHGFAVATRDDSAFAAAGLRVIDPWKTA
jgi:predicted nucleic acid-binding protein